MDPLAPDQDDYARLLAGDAFFADIPVLNQRKGVVDSDVDVALSTLNDDGGGKVGAVAIVLTPELQPDSAQTPSARYFVRIAIQAIVQPLFADDAATGVGITVEQLTERIRQVGHFRSFGRGNTWMFDGMEPISVEPGKNSYLVYFRRVGGDTLVAKPAAPTIASVAATSPATGHDITLTVPAGATAYYTIDGTLPTATHGTEYTAPFNIPAAATLRAIAAKTDTQQSEPAQLILT